MFKHVSVKDFEVYCKWDMSLNETAYKLNMFLQRKLKLRPFEILVVAVAYITLLFGCHAWRPGAYQWSL